MNCNSMTCFRLYKCAKETRDAQKQYTLHITDPQKFWSVSRYLVIQVK